MSRALRCPQRPTAVRARARALSRAETRAYAFRNVPHCTSRNEEMCTSRLQRHVSAIRPIRGRRGAMTLPMSLLDFVSLRSPFRGRCYAEPSLSATLHLTLCHYFHNSAMCIFSSSKEFIGLDRNFYEIFLFNIHFTFTFLFIIINLQ